MDLPVIRTVYKQFFSDLDRGMILRIIMDISKKDNSGTHVKKKYIENMGSILNGIDVEPEADFIIGYNTKNELIYIEIKSWDNNKKKLISNLIVGLLLYPIGKATFIEEINDAKDFYDKTDIIEPKFDSIVESFYS